MCNAVFELIGEGGGKRKEIHMQSSPVKSKSRAQSLICSVSGLYIGYRHSLRSCQGLLAEYFHLFLQKTTAAMERSRTSGALIDNAAHPRVRLKHSAGVPAQAHANRMFPTLLLGALSASSLGSEDITRDTSSRESLGKDKVIRIKPTKSIII